MTKIYKAGIFGVGAAAAEYMSALNSNSRSTVVAAVGRDATKTANRLSELGIEGCDVLNDYDELVRRKDIDIIVNTGPHQMHAAETIKAANAGKHVMFEKPAGMSLSETVKVYEEVKKCGVKTQQGTPILFNPYVLNVLKLLDEGLLGNIFFIEAGNAHELGPWWNGWTWGGNKRVGGPSAVLVTGIHAIAFLMRCAGEIEEVSGYQTWGHRQDFEYAPTYIASLKFKNGAVGSTYSTYENKSPYSRNFMIHGTKGSIVDEKFYLEELFPGQTGWQRFTTIMPDSGAVSHHAFKALVDDFIDAIDNDRPALVNIDETLKIHEVCFAITEAIETGKIVKLPIV